MENQERTLLVVDDERSNLDTLQRIFEREGFRVLLASSGREALEVLRTHRVHVILSDVMMPGMSGVDLLRGVKSVSPEVEIVLMTAYGTIELAVQAMKEGAYDFVEKPLKRAAIVKTVAKAHERRMLAAENKALKEELRDYWSQAWRHADAQGQAPVEAGRRGTEIVGSSPSLRATLEVAFQAAPSTATILILGESGTGKELLARQIHARSPRAAHSFVAVNCAAIPDTMMEAELFGHEKGAFTGAVDRRAGRFAQADGGTLFLDEIGEVSPLVQVKLLRVLQDGAFEPLGGRTQRSDVRIIAATNKDLGAAVKAGRFREDLYYRLNVIPIEMPPLRGRRDDIPLLCDHFLRQYCLKNNKDIKGFVRRALDVLIDYDWPGNVRELENAIERAVVLARSDVLDVADFPRHVTEHRGEGATPAAGGQIAFTIGTPLEEIERRMIRETLRHTDGDKRLAAQLLGIATRTIYRKLEQEQTDGGLLAGDFDDEE
jgi:two-component system response regulator HydG